MNKFLLNVTVTNVCDLIPVFGKGETGFGSRMSYKLKFLFFLFNFSYRIKN